MQNFRNSIDEEDNVIDFRDVLDMFKRRWKMILIVIILGTCIAGVISYFLLPPVYQSETKLFIGKEAADSSQSKEYNYNDVQMYKNMLKTYSEVIKTKDLIDAAVTKSGVDISEEKVMKKLIVSTIPDTQIIVIKYKSGKPQDSVDMLNAIKEEFIRTAKELVANGNIQVIEEPDFPEAPVFPKKKKNIAIGFLAGLVIGVGIAVILELMDNTYKNKEAIEKELNIPVIGVIPNLPEQSDEA